MTSIDEYGVFLEAFKHATAQSGASLADIARTLELLRDEGKYGILWPVSSSDPVYPYKPPPIYIKCRLCPKNWRAGRDEGISYLHLKEEHKVTLTAIMPLLYEVTDDEKQPERLITVGNE